MVTHELRSVIILTIIIIKELIVNKISFTIVLSNSLFIIFYNLNKFIDL